MSIGIVFLVGLLFTVYAFSSDGGPWAKRREYALYFGLFFMGLSFILYMQTLRAFYEP